MCVCLLAPAPLLLCATLRSGCTMCTLCGGPSNGSAYKQYAATSAGGVIEAAQGGPGGSPSPPTGAVTTAAAQFCVMLWSGLLRVSHHLIQRNQGRSNDSSMALA
jgi:hypothetical protein